MRTKEELGRLTPLQRLTFLHSLVGERQVVEPTADETPFLASTAADTLIPHNVLAQIPFKRRSV